jgi:hypothetical protein
MHGLAAVVAAALVVLKTLRFIGARTWKSLRRSA